MPIGGPTGGGQAGFGSGGSFTGASESLEYIGDFAYASSGLIQVTGSTYITHLKFTSGANLVVGEFTFFGASKVGDINTGDNALFRISVNGSIINYVKVETIAEDMPSLVQVPYLIAPYSEIEIESEATSSTSGLTVSTNFLGRVYRA